MAAAGCNALKQIATLMLMFIDCRYRGIGEFVLQSGERVRDIQFRIEQIGSGRSFLCVPRGDELVFLAGLRQLATFHGQLKDGREIKVIGRLREYVCSHAELCFIVGAAELTSSDGQGALHRLKVTNLLFPKSGTGRTSMAIQFHVLRGADTIKVKVAPLRGYEARSRYIQKTRTIAPTATVAFRGSTFSDEARADFINDVCHALSIVQGRKVNWIHHGTYGPRSRPLDARFGETITKPYSALPLCFDPTNRSGAEIPIAAAAGAIPAIERFRQEYDYDNRIINAWLDCRTEIDFLEARTLKAVVVIEALNAITHSRHKDLPTKAVDAALWKSMYYKVTNALPTEEAAVKALLTLANWNRLNSRAFADLLGSTLAVHNIREPEQTLKMFARVRNGIIHRFTYPSDISGPRDDGKLGLGQKWQHFFASSFVDRLVLRLFGLGAHVPNVSIGDG
jgi:hypothetical protein